MAVIMENDMIEGSTPLQPEDLRNFSDISKYQISRRKAELWAHKDIKFLVYDNTTSMANGYDSDDEEGMMDFATQMSRGSSTQATRANLNIKDANQPQIADLSAGSATPGQEDEKEPESCKFCSFIPEFPGKWRPRKFRLVKPELTPNDPGKFTPAEDICSHYVAISYCWPVPQQDEHGNTIIPPTTYQVRDLDGTIRPSRALDDVLDRAVDFAISFGIRMIWIDQECLPQPTEASSQEDKDYQQLGLQAMDIVYNRAVVTAGLLDSEVTSQEEIDIVNDLMWFKLYDSGRGIRWAGAGSGPGPPSIQSLKQTLDFLERVIRDRWYTRCWVAQEALSAGDRLMVVLRCDPSVSYRCQYNISRPGGRSVCPTPRSERRIQSEVIAIPVKRLRNLFKITEFLAKYFLHGRVFRENTSVLGGANADILALVDRAAYITTVAKKLQPAASGPSSFFMVAGTSYGPRQTVDAAGALTLLRTRNCRDVPDRVVIVANMCNFANRLDTRALGQNCKSLRLAVLALSVLNGDYSLLVPEAYRLQNAKDESYNVLSQPTMRWLWPLSANPHLIDSCSVRPGGHISQSSHDPKQPFSSDGLNLSAYLWVIENQVDFTPIQLEWAEEWNKLRSLRVLMKLGESPEKFLERQRILVNDLLSGQSVVHEHPSGLLSPSDWPVEDGIDKGASRGQDHADAVLLKCFPDVQTTVANIIFAVLRFLFNNKETDPRAMPLANSIWHSVRVSTISGKDLEDLPDDVGDWIFCHHAVVDAPYTLLQLDETRDGSLGQLWFLERIMRDGFLWVGHVDNTNEWLELKDHLAGSTDIPSSTSSASKGKLPAHNENDNSASPPNIENLKTRSIMRRQMTRKMIAMLCDIFSSTVEETPSGWAMDPRNLAACAEHLFYHIHPVNRGQREFVAAFDVDEPCIVAIPYNGEWEMLPRPVMRSMSVCWVVESVPDGAEKGLCKDPGCEIVDNDTGDAPDSVKSESDNVLQHASTSPARDNGPGKQHAQSETSSPEDTGSEDECLSSYKVLSKTRGLWPIIPEKPRQRYRFV